MATRIFPSQNDVHDTTGQGRAPTEANLNGLRSGGNKMFSHYRDGDQIADGGVLSGFDFSAGTATSITLTAGTAMIQGYNCEETTTISGTLTASTFNFVFLTVDLTSSLATGLSLSVVTAATFNANITPPTDPSILLWCFQTDATTITTQYDFRQVGSGVMLGSYVGDDTATRTINLGFRPKLVQVHCNEESSLRPKFIAQSPLPVPRVSGQQRGFFMAAPNYCTMTNDPEHVPVLTEDGFTIQDGPATPEGPRWLEDQDTWNTGTINAGLTATTNVTVTGARANDIVILDHSDYTGKTIILHARVSADDNVLVYATNVGASSTSLTGTLSVGVFQKQFQPKLNQLSTVYYFIAWF